MEGGGGDKGMMSGAMRRGHSKVVTAELIMRLPDEVAQVMSPNFFFRGLLPCVKASSPKPKVAGVCLWSDDPGSFIPAGGRADGRVDERRGHVHSGGCGPRE